MKLNSLGKKLLSVVTSALLIIPIGATAFKASALSGSGTSGSPYEIWNKDDLNKFRDKVNKGETSACAVLKTDIDYQSNEWYPIGATMGKKYCGNFDGKGHTISGLYNKSTSTNEIGFIGYTKGNAVIKNLTIKDSTIIGDKYVGAFVGKAGDNTTITNCHNKNTLVQGADKTGGLVGAAYNSTISNCSFSGTVQDYSTSGMPELGGVLGYGENMTFSDCISTGTIKINGGYMQSESGGIAGKCSKNATFVRCEFSGTNPIKNDKITFGAIVASCDGSDKYKTTIYDCVNGCTSNTDYGMGLVKFGYVSKIENCYSASWLFTENVSYGEIKNCYAASQNKDSSSINIVSNSQIRSGEIAYNLRKNSPTGAKWGQDLSDENSFPTLNAPTVYYGYENCISIVKNYTNNAVSENVKYSHKYDEKGICTVCGKSIKDDGDGTKEHPVPIYSPESLEAFANAVNKTEGHSKLHAYLACDIDMNPGTVFKFGGAIKENEIKKFTPIGNADVKFGGSIDGRGHTIRGLYVNDVDYAGLIGYGSGCSVENLKLDNCYIKGRKFAAGIVAVDDDCKYLKNISINENCNIIGEEFFVDDKLNIQSTGDAGGIIGVNCINDTKSMTVISDCKNAASVMSGSSSGGIIGKGLVANIDKCSNTGSVYGDDYSGGIFGFINSLSNGVCNINYVSNTGNVSNWGNSLQINIMGGIVGCTNTSVTINNSYCGAIYPGNFTRQSAAAIGYWDYNSFKISYANITNFCYDDSIKNLVNNKGGLNIISAYNISALPSSDFESGKVAYILNNKKSEGDIIWGQEIGKDKSPVIGGKTVYPVKNCKGEESYSNNKAASGHEYGESGKCSVCGIYEDTMSAYVANSVDLGETININFFMEIADEYRNNKTKMVFSVMEENPVTKENQVKRTIVIPFEDAEKFTQNNETYYKFTCKLSAKEMSNVVLAQIVNGDKEGKEFASSVSYYSYFLLNDETYYKQMSDEQKEVLIAMLNYGAAAQEYFGYNTANPANNFLPGDLQKLPDITAKQLENFAPVITTNNDYDGNVKYYGTSLLLDSETTIKHYFILEGNYDITKISCTDSAGQTYSVEKYGNGFVVKIKGISFAELGKPTEITVKENGREIGKISYSALSYAYTILKKYSENDENQSSKIKTAKALYNLYIKAEAVKSN